MTTPPDISHLLKEQLRESLADQLQGDALDAAVEELSEMAIEQGKKLNEAYKLRLNAELYLDDYMMCCNLCYPTWEYVCTWGAYQLWRDGPEDGDGAYYLMTEPGHRDDYVFRMATKPRPDPAGPFEDDENWDPDKDDPILVETCAWMDEVVDGAEFFLNSPTASYTFVTDMITLGFEFDGQIEFWIVHELGKVVQEKELMYGLA